MSMINWKYLFWTSILVLSIAGIKIEVPLFSATLGMAIEVLSISKRLESQETLLNQIRLLEQKNKTFYSRIKQTLADVPSLEQQSIIYEKLTGNAVKHRVFLRKLTPQIVAQNQGFWQLDIRVEIEANFLDLLRLLYDLEHQEKIFRVRLLELTPSPVPRFEVKGEIQLHSYLR
ncbi:MAG: hypothetical protein D6830_07895 [Ignavibacteria bacterium]|nr:MAG: hypothetical protein D6830_07895 [Ignavibacteria bacterium]